MKDWFRAPYHTTNKSGIYKIICTPTKRIYVGSAANIGGRLRGHLHDLTKNRHGNRFLQRAWNKYGRSKFTASVLVLCEKRALLDFEQKHLDRLRQSKIRPFNIHTMARSSFGIKRSSETIEKMRKASTGKTLSPEARKKISVALKKFCKNRVFPRWVIERARIRNTGRPLSKEHGEKIGNALRGRKRSKETIRKCSIAIKKSWILRRQKYPPKNEKHS